LPSNTALQYIVWAEANWFFLYTLSETWQNDSQSGIFNVCVVKLKHDETSLFSDLLGSETLCYIPEREKLCIDWDMRKWNRALSEIAQSEIWCFYQWMFSMLTFLSTLCIILTYWRWILRTMTMFSLEKLFFPSWRTIEVVLYKNSHGGKHIFQPQNGLKSKLYC
jgi:hypothetical protein